MGSGTLYGDALLVGPVIGTNVYGDALLVGPVSGTNLYGTARLAGPYGISYCYVPAITLVEGADYLLDQENGRIKFLSTGRLGGDLGGICNVNVQVCCANPQCDYIPDVTRSCDMACYIHEGYETVMQQGAENYRNEDEKMIKMIALEAEPLPQSTPSIVTAEIGYAAQPFPSCFTWRPSKNLDYECLTERTAAQHIAQKTRPDNTFYFPVWRRGRYLSARFIIDGIGGGGTFSAMSFQIKNWGQQDNP